MQDAYCQSERNRKPNYAIVEETENYILIKDLGPWDKYLTITNAPELVVNDLADKLGSRRLEYYDSEGCRDQILVRNGRFAGFAPVRPKIAIDIDGVIADIASLMIPEAEKEMGRPLSSEDVKTFGVDSDLVKKLTLKVLKHRLAEIPVYPDALTYIPKIQKEIGEITFLTARPDQYVLPTIRWLRTHFAVKFTMKFLPITRKAQFLTDDKFAYYIEDRITPANLIAEAGVTVYLITRPWNEARKVHGTVIRVDNFKDLYGQLLDNVLDKRYGRTNYNM